MSIIGVAEFFKETNNLVSNSNKYSFIYPFFIFCFSYCLFFMSCLVIALYEDKQTLNFKWKKVGKQSLFFPPQKKFILLDFFHKAKKQRKMPVQFCVPYWSPLQAVLYLLEGIQNDFEHNLKDFVENSPALLHIQPWAQFGSLKCDGLGFVIWFLPPPVVDNAYW